MEEKSETFHYTYSAVKQEEIKRIREKYTPSATLEDKMEQLRKLDASSTYGATVVALAVGIISTLIMGLGMCCTMVWQEHLFIPGIIIGVIGIVGIIAAYPVYVHMVKKKRAKLAPEIIRLTNELMK